MKRLNNKLYQSDLVRTAAGSYPWQKLFHQRILITGATGMIGTTLIDLLMYLNQTEGAGIHIYAMGRSVPKARERFEEYWENLNFTFMEHDIKNSLENVKEELGHIDFIIHGASTTHPVAYSLEPVETITANVIGLHNLMEYACQLHTKKVVFLSSVEIYGENRDDTEKFSENYCGFIDCNTVRAGYPESKRLGEALCQSYAKQYGIEVVIPRLSRVYGPTMLEADSKAIAQFIKKAVDGVDIVLKSDGSQLYSYCYVFDAVSGIVTSLLLGEKGQAYNISDSGSEITLKDLAGILADVSGTKVIFEIPDVVEQAGYSKATKAVLDAAKIEKIGWKPQIHIEEGLKRTVEILRGNSEQIIVK